jgi:hypothetical protein
MKSIKKTSKTSKTAASPLLKATPEGLEKPVELAPGVYGCINSRRVALAWVALHHPRFLESLVRGVKF